jgi:hypothetical protein
MAGVGEAGEAEVMVRTIQNSETRNQNSELRTGDRIPPSKEPVRLEQRLGPGHVLVVRVRYDRNYLGNPNGLRKGETHEVRRTRLMYLVKRRWHIADDFEVIGRRDV